MKVLVCNAGSTSLKFKLYEMPGDTVLAQGGVERVGSLDDAIYRYRNNTDGVENNSTRQAIPDYGTGIRRFLGDLCDPLIGVLNKVSEIDRVGYKTVLSKDHFGVHELDDETIQGMKDWIALAPAHNTAYLAAIEAVRAELPDTLFVGCFETAFHQSIPLARKLYGVPYEWYENYGVQRLGYHGASHGYIADCLNERSEGRPYRAVSCHLGGSSSICAIENGKSVNTSFGMSLETGVIHNNRVGDFDSEISFFLQKEGMSEAEVLEGLQKKGGLLGILGVSNDLRYVCEAADAGNERAALAVDVFVTGIVHYIGSFFIDLGGLDYLVLTAGIGEHSAPVRAEICRRLAPLGVVLDEAANEALDGEGVISAADSKVQVLVIPTNEELGIARRTFAFEK